MLIFALNKQVGHFAIRRNVRNSFPMGKRNPEDYSDRLLNYGNWKLMEKGENKELQAKETQKR